MQNLLLLVAIPMLIIQNLFYIQVNSSDQGCRAIQFQRYQHCLIYLQTFELTSWQYLINQNVIAPFLLYLFQEIDMI